LSEKTDVNQRPQGCAMPLEAKLRRRMQQLLSAVDDHDTKGPRLVDDAPRLWNRIQSFIVQGFAGKASPDQTGAAEPDAEALELACYALQLPQRQHKPPTAGKLGRTNLKDRAEQSAELLVSMVGDEIDEGLLDRTTRLLHEMPHRSPVPDEARLLADGVNLDDFGVTGLVMQIIQLARQGDGLLQFAEGMKKRDEYGYWEARLKDGFHFPQVRDMAKERVEHARQVAALLNEELNQDSP
jgi:hypothetical protein